MNTLLRIASYLLVLLGGVGVGFYLAPRIDLNLALDIAETDYLLVHMERQFSEGTDATREEAVHSFLALNERRKARPNEFFTEKVLATDSALAYARLAALAQKRGATQEAQQYLNHAESFCPQIGWKDCSAEKIAFMVQRLDEQGIFRTGPNR